MLNLSNQWEKQDVPNKNHCPLYLQVSGYWIQQKAADEFVLNNLWWDHEKVLC